MRRSSSSGNTPPPSRGGGGGGGGGAPAANSSSSSSSGLADLRGQLRSLSNTTKPEAAQTRRDVFRRVISYMTVSIDVAPLFSDMLMAAAAAQNDIVLKKMLYLYICTYAATTPDLALLAVNTLVKVRSAVVLSACVGRVRCGGGVDQRVRGLASALGAGLCIGGSDNSGAGASSLVFSARTEFARVPPAAPA